MQFEYEISADEYSASQALYHKLSAGRWFTGRAVVWVISGAVLLLVAWNEKALGLAPVLLALVGAQWIYCGILALFPGRHFRRQYSSAGLAGNKFRADVKDDGFDVVGELWSWRVRWSGVRLKGEDKRVFMLSSQGTIFMFGKKYLTEEQQNELRRLASIN